MHWKEIGYSKLNARQKENYNYAKLSAVLADFGYLTIRLSDDWNGADYIALHVDGHSIPVQLKGRLSFRKAYRNRQLHIAFPADPDGWYFYPHDELLEQVLNLKPTLAATKSWSGRGERGGYSFPRLDRGLCELLQPYRIAERNKTPIAISDGVEGDVEVD